MHKEINHRIRKHFNEGIYNVARYTEIVLSIVILIVIALTGIRLIYTLTEISILDMDIDFFTEFLANALSLVDGVEFVKCSAVILHRQLLRYCCLQQQEQMVVEHMDPVQTLIGVIAIAILFAIRKFLMTEDSDMAHEPFKEVKMRQQRKQNVNKSKGGIISCLA